VGENEVSCSENNIKWLDICEEPKDNDFCGIRKEANGVFHSLEIKMIMNTLVKTTEFDGFAGNEVGDLRHDD
jgi:hypothetical protein